MKRLLSAALLLVMVAAIPLAVIAEGIGNDATSSASSLREAFHYDFEDGSSAGLTSKATQICEVRTDASGNKFLAYGLTSEYANGTYLNMHAKDLTDDYQTDSTASEAKQYYNSETFTLSVAFSESDKSPQKSAYFEYKSSGKTVTCQFLHCVGGIVKTPGGVVLGEMTRGNWLKITVTLNVKTGAASYFVNGQLKSSETLSKTANNVSYFNLYISGNDVNAESELWLDQLSLSFGEVTEADTAYFENAFREEPPEEPELPGGGSASETVRETFRRAFDDGKVGTSYRAELCKVIADPANASNSCLEILSNGEKDLFYHIDAKETASYLLDPDAVSKKDFYFDSRQLIISIKHSRTEATVHPVTGQIKSTTVGSTTVQKTLYSITSEGKLKTAGGTVIGTLEAGKWLSLDIGLDLDKGTVTYYLDRAFVRTESLSIPEKISYFNLSQGVRDAGLVLLADDLAVGYGTLTDAFYEIPVEFMTSAGKETVKYSTTTFALPDTAPYWYGRVNGKKCFFAAGTELETVKGLSFTASESLPVLLDGASIRADYHTGLRFGATYASAWYDALSSYFGADALTVGVLIVPTDALSDGTDFTHKALSEKYPTLADIVNRRWYSEENGSYSCYGTLSDLKDENYARKFSARAYLRIVDESGAESILYSAYTPEKHSRSAYEVARAAFADTAADYTEAQRGAIKGYLDGTLALTVDGSGCKIAEGPVGYSTPYTLVSADASSAVVSIASGTALKTVTVNGTPVYGFTVGDTSVTVTLD